MHTVGVMDIQLTCMNQNSISRYTYRQISDVKRTLVDNKTTHM